LKEKIEEEHKLPAEQLKLIVKGKVMEDPEQTIKDYKIEEGGFIVCMVTKAKPAAAKKEDKKEEDKPQVDLKPSSDAPVV
jgi:UV excision repair protein RAD23